MTKFSTPKLLTSAVGFAALSLAFCGAAHAGEIRAYAGKSIELKDVRGTVYYAPNGKAFDVVVTLDSDGRPVRFVSSLQPGQATTVSTPGAVGETGAVVEIKREGDHLFINDRSRQQRAEAAPVKAAGAAD
jgi:hypothetical protein